MPRASHGGGQSPYCKLLAKRIVCTYVVIVLSSQNNIKGSIHVWGGRGNPLLPEFLLRRSHACDRLRAAPEPEFIEPIGSVQLH